MKLYGLNLPFTRDKRVLWALEELGERYEFVAFDPGQLPDDYHRLSPSGFVPALEDGEVRLVESAGILLYLADKHAGAAPAPAPGSARRPALYQWIAYGGTSLESAAVEVFAASERSPVGADPEKFERARPRLAQVLKTLQPALEERSYLLGDDFTLADVAVGWSLNLVKLAGVLGDYPAVESYYRRLAVRPGFRAAFD